MITIAEKTVEKDSINKLIKLNDINLPLNSITFLIKNKPIQKRIKRFMDFSLSLLALIVLSPVFLLIILAIKFETRGPALFKQERIGLDEKIFYMYKFRSMVIDAEKRFEEVKSLNQTNSVMFKSKEDPRITKVGKFIRKYSLDELPQLLNILTGEMSIVGPRPPLPRELEHYQKWHHVKFFGKPGLTGLWQVSGRANIKDFNKVISLDYEYLRDWNILKDIYIILKTIPVVLSADGAD